MSTTHAAKLAKNKGGQSLAQRASAPGSAAGSAFSAGAGHTPAGLLSGADPAVRLNGGIQRQVAIGKADDSHEKEAEAVAARVTEGKSVEPQDISAVEPGAIPQNMSIQRDEASKPEEKKPEAGPVQKAEAMKPEEKKPVQKAEMPKTPEKKPEAVQKTEDKKPEQKIEGQKPVQKAEAEQKLPEAKPVQKAEAMKPEEKKSESKPVQKAEMPKPEEKKPVQKAEMPTTPEKKPEAVQKAEAKPPEQKIEDKKPVQKDAGGAGGSSGGESAAAQQAIAGKGTGNALNPNTRNKLESGLGVDLGHVRVHDDAAARNSANALNARAFTHGNDIWMGPGASQDDTHLMAHEATHVVQQAGGARKMVQKANGVPKPAGGSKKPTLSGNTITIPRLEIPDFKQKFLKKKTDVTIPKEVVRPKGESDQRAVWDGKVRDKLKGTLPKQVEKYPGIIPDKGEKSGIRDAKQEDKDKRYFFEIGGKKNYLIGTKDELAEALVFPRWDPQGQPKLLDADHKEEVQLGGDPGVENLHLLDASANRSAGGAIQKAISKTIKEAADKLRAETDDPKKKQIPQTPDAVRSNYTIIYQEIGSTGKSPNGADAKWDKKEVEEVAAPLSKLRPIGAKEAGDLDLVGSPTRLTIYPFPGGGQPKHVKDWKTGEKTKDMKNAADWIKGFTAQSVTYEPDKGGTVSGKVETRRMKKQGIVAKQVDWKLVELGGIPYTTYIDPGSLSMSMQFAELKMFSPINFQTATIDDVHGLVARGKLMPSIPLFKKLDLDISFEGGDLWISKTFTKSDFDIPKPLSITEASLTLAVSPSAGFRVEGDVFLEIEKVGKGSISAVKDSEGFELTGQFDFDSKLFDPASVKMAYSKGELSGEGKLGIKPGKVRGIESASITASFKGNAIKASGTVKPKIPGIEQGDMTMSYDEKTGLVIGGTLQLKKDLPGISGGSVSAEVTKKPGEERYIVKASGQATPKIPGISSQLMVSYDDGAFDATITAGYERGRLKGSITAGATNRPVGDDGKPAGAAPEGKADKITFYGGGSLTLKLTSWLEGTAGVMFKPDGKIQIVGEIGIPGTIDIFPEKKLDKNIFKIGIDIPIVGVAVAGQRIGIFANISGGLDLSAGIGPGQLQGKLKVDYTPDDESKTHVQGDVNLHVPAHAGLRMFVRGSVGVGIPIVSAQAGIEIGGQLGLEGALDTGVHVDWTPAKGLVLDAKAEVYVEPKLKFDITGFVLVEADLFITTIELYNKRWQLAAFEYGSGLRFGVSFPMHYEEGKPLDLSLDNVKFQVPEIKPKELIADLVKKIA